MEDSDVVLLYRTTHGFWDRTIISWNLKRQGKKIICVGQNPAFWTLSTVEPRIATEVYDYLLNGTGENFRRLAGYPGKNSGQQEIAELSGDTVAGSCGSRSEGDIFDSLEEYLRSYPSEGQRPRVAVIVSRSAWISGQNSIEKER